MDNTSSAIRVFAYEIFSPPGICPFLIPTSMDSHFLSGV